VVSWGKRRARRPRVDEGVGVVSEDAIEHPRARGRPAWAWAWTWAWALAWASRTYEAGITYLIQPSSEGGRVGVGVGVGMGVGEDVEEVGGIWQRGGRRVGWALACGRGVGQWRKRVDEGEGEGVVSGECSGKVFGGERKFNIEHVPVKLLHVMLKFATSLRHRDLEYFWETEFLTLTSCCQPSQI
jgi:hypothetical protein